MYSLKNNKFKIILGSLILLGLILFALLKSYNKPHIDTNSSKADITTTSKQIIHDFTLKENEATPKYTNKIIQLKGEVSNISFENGANFITLKSSTGEANIICELLPEENEKVSAVKIKDQITIKGICSGYLLDIIMVRCVIVNQ